MKKRYEFLLFDIDGTLLDYDAAERNALRNAVKAYGVAYDVDVHLEVYKEINTDTWRKFERNEITAVELRTERFQRFAAHIGVEMDPEEMSRIYLDFLKQEADHIPNAMDVVKEVSGKFKLALITNGLRDVQHPRIDKSGFREFFPSVIISEEVGIAKPHAEIFEHAFNLADHADKDSALIIGDSLSSDIGGGMAFGIDTCWINHSGRPHGLEQSPTYTITDLCELLEIVL